MTEMQAHLYGVRTKQGVFFRDTRKPKKDWGQCELSSKIHTAETYTGDNGNAMFP